MNRSLLLLFLYVTIITTCLILYQYNLTTCQTQIIKVNNEDVQPKNVENIPRIYFAKTAVEKKFNKTCAKFPEISDLKFSVDPWQIQEITNGTVQLFSAYVDDRGQWLIRIMVMINLLEFDKTLYCHLWFDDDKKPIILQSEKPLMLWYKAWGRKIKNTYYPYIITCPLTKSKQVPMSVSLVEKRCDHPSNNLRVHYKKNVESKKNFLVCVKGLNFPFDDISLRLVEWIELITLLGADKIHFYNFKVHPQVDRVLDYYQEKNIIEVVPLTLIGGASNKPHLQTQYLHQKAIERRLQEIIPYNDCLYKHLQEFKFVAVLDIDEVIVPKNGTWINLLENLEKNSPNKSSFMVRNVYFLDTYLHNHTWFGDIPEYMHILQHVYRNEKYSKPGWFVKGFHNVSRILGLHNHFAYACLDQCNHFDLDPDVAHLQHYRSDCVKSDTECSSLWKESIKDTRIWNFKDLLIDRVERTVTKLKLL